MKAHPIKPALAGAYRSSIEAIVLPSLCGVAIACFVASTTFSRALGLSLSGMVLFACASFALYLVVLWRATRLDRRARDLTAPR
jgi:hypothetical protein